MAVRQMGLDVRPFLPHAVAATLGVVALPAAAIFGLLFLLEPDPNLIVTSAISIALTGAATTFGASLWMRQERSSELSFGDLMLWSWCRRKRAEDRLAKSTDLLGLDRSGNPRETPAISRAKQLRILHEMNEALEAKDPYTRGHAGRVERHVFRTGAAMGLSVKDLDDLRLAAALHDVGKIRVPDSVLRKDGPLTDAERAVMNEHPSVGAWMVSHVGTQDVIEAVRYHHERWDGRGYPDGIAATEIPLFARIIAVADTYDAITSTRSYRVKSESGKALAIIKAEAGKQLDPLCVDAFVKALPHKVPVSALLFLMPSALREGAKQIALLFTRQGLASVTAGAAAAGAAVGIGSVAVKPLSTLPVKTKPAAIVRTVPVPRSDAASTAARSALVAERARLVVPKKRESRAAGRGREASRRLDRAFRSQVRGGGREPGVDIPVAAPVDELVETVENDGNDSDRGSSSSSSEDGSSSSGSGSASGNSDSNNQDGSSGSNSGKGDSGNSQGNGNGASEGSGNSDSDTGKGSSSSGKGTDKTNGNEKGGKETPDPSPQASPDSTDTGTDTDTGTTDTGSTDGTEAGTTDGGSSGDSGGSSGGGSSNGGGNSGGNGNSGGSSGSNGNSGGNGNGGDKDKDKGDPDV